MLTKMLLIDKVLTTFSDSWNPSTYFLPVKPRTLDKLFCWLKSTWKPGAIMRIDFKVLELADILI